MGRRRRQDALHMRTQWAVPNAAQHCGDSAVSAALLVVSESAESTAALGAMLENNHWRVTRRVLAVTPSHSWGDTAYPWWYASLVSRTGIGETCCATRRMRQTARHIDR